MEEKDDAKKSYKTYLKFSNIAIQMGVIIGLGAWGGNWLDEKQENEFPVWTLILTLAAIFGSLYQVIREVNKMSEKKESPKEKEEEDKK